MEKMLDVQEILDSIREDGQQLEKLITDLKKEEDPSAATRPEPVSPTVFAPHAHGENRFPVMPD